MLTVLRMAHITFNNFYFTDLHQIAKEIVFLYGTFASSNGKVVDPSHDRTLCYVTTPKSHY